MAAKFMEGNNLSDYERLISHNHNVLSTTFVGYKQAKTRL